MGPLKACALSSAACRIIVALCRRRAPMSSNAARSGPRAPQAPSRRALWAAGRRDARAERLLAPPGRRVRRNGGSGGGEVDAGPAERAEGDGDAAVGRAKRREAERERVGVGETQPAK